VALLQRFDQTHILLFKQFSFLSDFASAIPWNHNDAITIATNDIRISHQTAADINGATNLTDLGK
jgi:hypothetical protein